MRSPGTSIGEVVNRSFFGAAYAMLATGMALGAGKPALPSPKNSMTLLQAQAAAPDCTTNLVSQAALEQAMIVLALQSPDIVYLEGYLQSQVWHQV
eukprot:1920420-Amphidinium_carterae.1